MKLRVSSSKFLPEYAESAYRVRPASSSSLSTHSNARESCTLAAVVQTCRTFLQRIARAEKGAELWRKGDLEGYGQLVFESGRSSIYSYECGCDELKKLYEIMRETDGIYGGRFSGAGFKGCCMALIDPDKLEDIEAKGNRKIFEGISGAGREVFVLCVRKRRWGESLGELL